MFDVDAGWLDHTQKTPLHQTAGCLPCGIREPSVPARSESSVCVRGEWRKGFLASHPRFTPQGEIRPLPRPPAFSPPHNAVPNLNPTHIAAKYSVIPFRGKAG